MKRQMVYPAIKKGGNQYTVYNPNRKFESFEPITGDRYPFGRTVFKCPECKAKMEKWEDGNNVKLNGSWSWSCYICKKTTTHKGEMPLFSHELGYWVTGNKRMVYEGETDVVLKTGRNQLCVPSPNSKLLEGATCVDTGGHNVKLKWEKDNFDNWCISPIITTPDTNVHLKWKVICPILKDNYWLPVKEHFSIPLPVEGIDKDSLPSDMNAVAQQLIDQLGLKTTNSALVNISALGKHCAGFSCGTIPPGDMLVETFKNKVGACRHRAMDFMVAGLKLGINCRYVVSDCHAWVEIWEPKLKIWIALDLGGCGGGGSNPDDLNPPKTPEEKPDKPEEKLPETPEAPEEKKRTDIRQMWRDAGMKEEDIDTAYQVWKKVGGKG